MRHFLPCFLFLLASIAAVAQDKLPPLKADMMPASVKRYVDACLENRIQSTIRLDARLVQTKEALKTPKSKEHRQRLNEGLRSLNAAIKKNRESLRPMRLDYYPKLKVGAIGEVDGFTIRHIIDGKAMMVSLHGVEDNSAEQMYLTGTPTAGRIDGEFVEGPLVIEIVGTKKLGSTIYAIELVPFEAWKEIALRGIK